MSASAVLVVTSVKTWPKVSWRAWLSGSSLVIAGATVSGEYKYEVCATIDPLAKKYSRINLRHYMMQGIHTQLKRALEDI